MDLNLYAHANSSTAVHGFTNILGHDHTGGASGAALGANTVGATQLVNTLTWAQVFPTSSAGNHPHSSNTTGGTISHTSLSSIGTNTHAIIDSHIANSSIHFGMGSIDHGLIAGLADDDHTQYSLANGTRAFTGKVAGVSTASGDAGTTLATKDYVDSGSGAAPKCWAWMQANGAGVASLGESYNMFNVSQAGNIFTFTFSVTFSNTNYAVLATGTDNFNNDDYISVVSKTTTSVGIQIKQEGAGVGSSNRQCSIAVFGTLA